MQKLFSCAGIIRFLFAFHLSVLMLAGSALAQTSDTDESARAAVKVTLGSPCGSTG